MRERRGREKEREGIEGERKKRGREKSRRERGRERSEGKKMERVRKEGEI